MSTINRRELLRSLLTGALETGGAVVLACLTLPAGAAQENHGLSADRDLQERADRLASEEGASPEGQVVGYYGGGFRRGGFANGGSGGGGFRRGGWGN